MSGFHSTDLFIGGLSYRHSSAAVQEKFLPTVDNLRNLFLTPTPEVLSYFQHLHTGILDGFKDTSDHHHTTLSPALDF